MRFNSSIRNISKFTRLTASLSSLDSVAWLRLDNDQVRFTVIPEQGTQVWAILSIDSIFDAYNIQSASTNNTINLEVPIPPLLRALKSAYSATSASLRLTKNGNVPLLAFTIVRSNLSSAAPGASLGFDDAYANGPATAPEQRNPMTSGGGRDSETVVTQNVPVRVLSAAAVEGIQEPYCGEPEVYIMLPSLMQLKGISDRFTKVASGARLSLTGVGPKLELSGNMQGSLRLRVVTESLSLSSVWTGLTNPELDPAQTQPGQGGTQDNARPRPTNAGTEGDEGQREWATVRIDGKDWSKVLSVGRLGGRVIACFINEQALILYVYLSSTDDGNDDSVLTYYISSFST